MPIATPAGKPALSELHEQYAIYAIEAGGSGRELGEIDFRSGSIDHEL